ncbi:MAG: methyltransferase domain-containing protein [Anaerolineae bacterium]|nr:methyltransferase domain-containing protein [Anaerolineae bacterium]
MNSERDLHERVAQTESHEAQLQGIVGWFYNFYRQATFEFLARLPQARALEIGCGEGTLLRGLDIEVIQLDISVHRLNKARNENARLLCADGLELPFVEASFEGVLLIAVLEHVSQPERMVSEVSRILKPGGEVAILVPNDVWMSLGRLILFKWPPRYPDHLSWISPRRIRRMAGKDFKVSAAYALPLRQLPFALNMYYWVTLKKYE